MPIIGSPTAVTDQLNNFQSNKWQGHQFLAPTNGNVATFSFYCAVSDASTAHYKGIITDSSFNILTNGITSASTALPTSSAFAWVDAIFATPPTITRGNIYYFGYIPESDAVNYYYEFYPNIVYGDSSNSYASPTSPTDATLAFGIYRVQMYLTYTETDTNKISTSFHTRQGFQ